MWFEMGSYGIDEAVNLGSSLHVELLSSIIRWLKKVEVLLLHGGRRVSGQWGWHSPGVALHRWTHEGSSVSHCFKKAGFSS
jgi:hypothetical protein